MDNSIGSRPQADPLVLNSRADVVGNSRTDKILTMPSRTNAAGVIVCVSACPNDRRIANSAESLVGHASGGGSGSDITPLIKGHGSHGAEFAAFIGIGYGFDGRKILITHDGVLELPTTPLRVEVFVINKLKLLGLREGLSTLTHKHYMG